MTCVNYDHVFANDIEAKLPNFDTLLAANSQKKAVSSVGTQPAPVSVARLTPDVESEDEEEEDGQEQEQEQSKESESAKETSEPLPADLSPRRPRVASQEVLKRIEEGLIKDFGVEDSDSDYIEEESHDQ